jgi:hypothetical protein
MNAKSRGERNIYWVENFCLFPSGPDKGKRVRLSPRQREMVLRLYDGPMGLMLKRCLPPWPAI